MHRTPDRITKQKAMEMLGLNFADDREAIEEKLDAMRFALKNEILQKYMVPSLLRKKEPLLQSYAEAEASIQAASEEPIERPEQWKSLPENRITFLEEYEIKLSELKLRIMQATSFAELNAVMEVLILTQEYYMALFKLLFSEFSEALPEEVNSREMIDTGKLLQSLKSGQIDNKTVWAIEREITRIDRIARLKQST